MVSAGGWGFGEAIRTGGTRGGRRSQDSKEGERFLPPARFSKHGSAFPGRRGVFILLTAEAVAESRRDGGQGAGDGGGDNLEISKGCFPPLVDEIKFR